MAKPSNLVVWAMCQKMSDRSWVFSAVKLGKCLLKYSSLTSLTRLVSWLNASWEVCISTLCNGGISFHFELGSPSGVALDVVLPGGETSTGSGEGVATWVWVNAQAQEGKEPLEKILAQ